MSFIYRRDEEAIALEASLDGLYVVRTTVKKEVPSTEKAVTTCKRFAVGD